MSYFILVVVVLVNGEVTKETMVPLAAYDSKQACELEASPYRGTTTLVWKDTSYKFGVVCVENDNPAGLDFKQSV